MPGRGGIGTNRRSDTRQMSPTTRRTESDRQREGGREGEREGGREGGREDGGERERERGKERERVKDRVKERQREGDSAESTSCQCEGSLAKLVTHGPWPLVTSTTLLAAAMAPHKLVRS